jgi:hypothetical protein
VVWAISKGHTGRYGKCAASRNPRHSSAGVRSDRPLSSLNPGGCKYEAASVDTQKGRRDVIDGVQAGDS